MKGFIEAEGPGRHSARVVQVRSRWWQVENLDHLVDPGFRDMPLDYDGSVVVAKVSFLMATRPLCCRTGHSGSFDPEWPK